MSAIQISNTLDNLALGCSTSQADLTWAIQRNLLPAGTQPRYIRIDNINNSTGVFVSVTKETETITVPGSSTTGNCFYVAPNNSVTVELITAGGNVASSAFNDGSGNCVISGITLDATAIITITPVGE
ncbi:hypothetical protein UFOVP1369_39 [uncultured Caudovirales phage]|uniref:Uncharacterized protein n=1 Tax=uncultured Caudovirales phage TaxID=2100421 RepID=A0A6J5S2X0_9CAUD|nr:hypothetical protein UFOVP1369_39 [uncultured Caudovirales phage]